MNTNILWLTGHHFEPATMGLFTYSHGVSSSLSAAGAAVSYVGHEREEVPRPQDPAWTLLGSTSRRTVRGQLTPNPFMIAEIWDAEAKRRIGPLARDLRPDAIIIDHLRSAGALDHIRGVAPIVYLSHNHESSVKRASLRNQNRWHHRAAYSVDLAKLARIEQRVCDAAGLVTAISASDADSYRMVNGVEEDRLLVLPPAYSRKRREARTIDAETPRRVVMVNNLAWDVKERNTLELLEVLAERLRDDDVELAIVGGDADINRSLADRFPSVTFPGFVSDLESYLGDCRMAIMYEPVGGGLKMKVLDYVFNRVPIVALPAAMEGIPLTPGRDYLPAGSPGDVADHVLATIDDLDRLNALHDAAADACSDAFMPDRVGKVLLDRVESLVTATRNPEASR